MEKKIFRVISESSSTMVFSSNTFHFSYERQVRRELVISKLGKGNAVTCSCGLHVSMNEYGAFDSPAPFENIAQWDEWQHARLLDEDFAHEGAYFSEEEVTLAQLDQAGAETVLLTGELSIDRAALSIGERSFPLAEIDDMALIQRRKLAFMHRNMYYELQTPEPRCLRKYYAAWKNAAARAKNA